MAGRVGPAACATLLAAGWLIEVGLQLQQAALWSPGAVAGAAGTAAALALVVWRWRSHWAGASVLMLTAVALAHTSTAWRAQERLADSLPAALEGRDIVATGVVAELPRQSSIGTRFVLEPEASQLDGAAVRLPPRLALGWYRGAASVMAGLPVRMLSTSLADDHPLRLGHAASVPHRRCDAGQAWQWDGVRFEVLHPLPGDHALGLKPNALSCVLRVQGAAGSALLTGDIEAAQEAALVQRAAAALPSDVLLVPHHGSRTSSSATFLDAVRPRVAVVQAAYRSRFGHPAADVMARYAERGIEVVRSDRCGAWTLRPEPGAGDPVAAGVCERERARRYWHHRFETGATMVSSGAP